MRCSPRARTSTRCSRPSRARSRCWRSTGTTWLRRPRAAAPKDGSWRQAAGCCRPRWSRRWSGRSLSPRRVASWARRWAARHRWPCRHDLRPRPSATSTPTSPPTRCCSRSRTRPVLRGRSREFLKLPTSLRREAPRLYEGITSRDRRRQGRGGAARLLRQGADGLGAGGAGVPPQVAARWAGFLGDIADQPFRVASWTGHAPQVRLQRPRSSGDELLDSDDPEDHARSATSSRSARARTCSTSTSSPRRSSAWPACSSSGRSSGPRWRSRLAAARVPGPYDGDGERSTGTAGRLQERATRRSR